MSYSNVTIVIPTFKRLEFIKRTLAYYYNNAFKGTLLIGDSSDEKIRNLTQDYISSNKIPNAIYCNCEHIDITNTVILLMDRVTTKYVTFCGDDDYLIPSSIERCIDFLDSNPAYSGATGRMVQFAIHGYLNGKEAVYGPVTYFGEYPTPSFEQEAPRERLKSYSTHYPVITFSVFRTECRIPYYRYANVASKDNSILGEIGPNCCSVIAGKFKSFPHLHVLRQLGPHHDTNPDYADGKSREPIDWLLNEKFIESSRFYLDMAAHELTLVETLSLSEANSIVSHAYQTCIAGHLLHPMFYLKAEPRPWFPEHEELRQFYRSASGEYDWTPLPDNSRHPAATHGTRPSLLFITQRWNNGNRNKGVSATAKCLTDSLLSGECFDSSIIYTDQILLDQGKSSDRIIAEKLAAARPDCVVVLSSALHVNGPRPSTLALIRNSNIPLVLLWDSPLSSSPDNAITHHVFTTPPSAPLQPNHLALWPPVDLKSFHDPCLERDVDVYCLTDVMTHQEPLAYVRRLLREGIEPQGIRDWRYDYFIKKGHGLDAARTFRSFLFDPDYYLNTYTIALPPGMDILAHYKQTGWKLNYNPNPLFDSAYYRLRHPDSEAPGLNPLFHFMTVGVHRGCNPHPFFDTLFYLASYPDVVASGMNPLDHYLQYGVAEGRTACAPMGKHEYARQLKRSRIAINIRGGHIDEQTALRASFEAILCGALLLEPAQSPLSNWFVPMADYIPYMDLDDLIVRVRYFLAHEDRRSAIARQGQQKASTQYTGQIFWQKLREAIFPPEIP